jgi:hypothetical protein
LDIPVKQFLQLWLKQQQKNQQQKKLQKRNKLLKQFFFFQILFSIDFNILFLN